MKFTCEQCIFYPTCYYRNLVDPSDCTYFNWDDLLNILDEEE